MVKTKQERNIKMCSYCQASSISDKCTTSVFSLQYEYVCKYFKYYNANRQKITRQDFF